MGKRRRKRGPVWRLWTHRAALAAIGGGGALVVFDSGAFSVSEVGRSVRFDTAGDDGLLGISTDVSSQPEGGRLALLELTNNSGETLETIAASGAPVEDDDTEIETFEAPGQLEPGDSGLVTAALTCESADANVRVEIDLAASGSEVDIDATRVVDLSCPEPAFDPSGGADVWRAGLDHAEAQTDDLELDGETRAANAAITSDDVNAELDDGAAIDGFLRIEGDDIDVEIEEGSTVNGAVVGDVNAILDDGGPSTEIFPSRRQTASTWRSRQDLSSTAICTSPPTALTSTAERSAAR
jgi:hypothetical protein